MIYFDNAATTLPKPPQVGEAVAQAINTFGNPGRGAHAASLLALRCLADARTELADLLHADSSHVVLCSGATEALNVAIGGVQGHIVTTAAEHNSLLRPLYRRGNFDIVPVDARGCLSIDALYGAIKPDTEAVVIGHASNVTGNVIDLEAVAELCQSKRVRLIVDAAQTAGLIDVDVSALGISALCFSGHKSLYGPQGVGALVLSEDFQPPALAVGGSGYNSFSHDHPNDLPDALEAGTRNAHSVAGWVEGIRYVKSLNGEGFAKADQLARAFGERVRLMPGYVLYGHLDAPLRTPVISLNHKRLDAATLSYLLFDQYDMYVRAGAHCAPLMHEALGTGERGTVRFSFSHFNTDEEIHCALRALREISREAEGE